jgi:hypothetical protein
MKLNAVFVAFSALTSGWALLIPSTWNGRIDDAKWPQKKEADKQLKSLKFILNLASDKTFSFSFAVVPYTGTYRIEGNRLVLDVKQIDGEPLDLYRKKWHLTNPVLPFKIEAVPDHIQFSINSKGNALLLDGGKEFVYCPLLLAKVSQTPTKPTSSKSPHQSP